MGTLSAKVDTVSPNAGLDVIGSNGTNNWYVSPATITATGSDATSGVSSIQLSVNSGTWTSSTTLNDGIYAVDVRAEDNAGNVSTSSTTISVDTVTPSISLNVNGTMGSNGWYSSDMQVTASASDLTSGVASLEVSTDGGVYQAYTSPISFTDGYHTIRFKATDNAGNQTETPIQEFYVDTTAPAIDLPSSWEVNKTIEYNIQDNGSGLAALRIVIEDEDEKYKKVTWNEEVSGNKFKGEITWNGKFKDGTLAPPGEYLVWIKAKDQAGNERFGLGKVIVPQPNAVFSLLQPATTNNQETLLPPQELFDEDELPITNSSATTTSQQNLSFGESITDPKESTQTSLSLATGTASASTATNSNILWGATAAALIGWATATALEEKKKRKEQEQAKARASRDEEPPMTRQDAQARKHGKELQKLWNANGAAIYEANREYTAKHGKEMDVAARSKAIKDATMNGVFNAGAYVSNLEVEKTRQDAQNERMANKMTRFEKEEEVRWQAQQKATEEKEKAQDLQDGLAAYYAAIRQGEKEDSTENKPGKAPGHAMVAAPAIDPPPWWKELIDAGKKVVEDAKEWVDTKVVQPAKETVNKAITTAKNFITTTVTTVKEAYESVKKDVDQKWKDTKQTWEDIKHWVNTNVVQPHIHQAFRVGWMWLTEQGGGSTEDDPMVFGPDDQMTQDFMNSEGVQEAWQEFLENGGVQPKGYHAVEVNFEAYYKGFIFKASWTETFIGGHIVYITNNGDGTATFEIYNTTGLASLTHNPESDYTNPSIETILGNLGNDPFGYMPKRMPTSFDDFMYEYSPSSIFIDRNRSESALPGGNMYQLYTWTWPIP